MRWFLSNNRIKIFSAIILAFIFTIFISNWLGKTEPNEPAKIAFLAQSSAENITGNISSGFTNLLKPLSLFKFGYTGSNSENSSSQNQMGQGFILSPIPTEENNPIPTNELNPSTMPLIPTTTSIPYKKPTTIPTKKPTSVPPTPTTKAIPLNRPGTTRDEIADSVGKMTCVPPAILKAINDEETNLAGISSIFSLVNTYGWWNQSTTTKAQICLGYAYNECTAIIPADSNFANQTCPIITGGCSVDINIMGPMQLSQYEQDSYMSQAQTIMKQTTVDRRVIYDSFLIGALHFKNISLYRDSDCNNWPFKNVIKTACKYYGKCTYKVNGNTGNYCQIICNNYNKYAGTSYDCSISSINSIITDGGGCIFK